MKLFFFSVLGCLLIGAGCNPLRRIEMKNQTRDTVQFIWTLTEDDSLSWNPFFLYSSKELKIIIPPGKHHTARLSFGYGIWSPTEVHQITKGLESLEIITPSQKIRLDPAGNIKNFLLPRRKALGKKIVIVVRQ